MISGTSHDGIDVAVVDIDADGERLDAGIIRHGSYPYDQKLRRRLVASLPPSSTTLDEVAQLDTLIGQAFADAAATTLSEVGEVDLIVSHGQTVYHWVEGTAVHGTLQIGQPAWVAERTGTAVLSDVRSRDISAGGQGAPLASTLDALLLNGRDVPAGALNLGGISNLTAVAEGGVRAWDIGPANALIDAVVSDRALHPLGYDAGGSIAASGTVDQDLLELLLAEPYYAASPPKTTGKELFHLQYVHEAVNRYGKGMDDADLVATLTFLTVRTVADAVMGHSLRELFVSGGGAHNCAMMNGLREQCPGVEVSDTSALGVGADEKEAALMALLGWLSWHGVGGVIPSATGARAARILGSLTPGERPLQLPEPGVPPTSLRFRTEG